MKKVFTNQLYLSLASIFTLIVLMSSSLGRGNIFGQAVTGAPGDTNRTCASSGCHSSGAFEPDPKLTLTDDDGNIIVQYIPGQTYNARLTIETTGNPSRFGFQMVSLGESDVPLNNWENFGNDIQEVTIGDRVYLEHRMPSSSSEFETQWVAPEAGSGDVSFYFAVNAANGNGGSTGDGGANDRLVISELTSSTTNLLEESITLYPTATQDWLNISSQGRDLNYSIFDWNGQRIHSANLMDNQSTIDVSQYQKGLYFITFQKDDFITTKRFFKL